MKEILLQYARYNIWANNLIIDAMLKLRPEAIDAEVVSSFPSVRKTVYHTWGAEYVWVQRLQRAPHPVWVPAAFTGSFEEACSRWQQSSQQLLSVIESAGELTDKIDYQDLKLNAHSSRMCDMLLHVFNHGTYHRGQLVTMLRQLGVQEIPSTDLINYVRMNH